MGIKRWALGKVCPGAGFVEGGLFFRKSGEWASTNSGYIGGYDEKVVEMGMFRLECMGVVVQ